MKMIGKVISGRMEQLKYLDTTVSRESHEMVSKAEIMRWHKANICEAKELF